MNINGIRKYTLIEVLIVISIISLLVSILLPALQRAKTAAKRIACASNIKQCGSGMFMYANDNDNWLPFRENWSDLYRRPPESGEMADTDGWVYVNCGLLISGKYISKEVLHCAGSEEKGIDTWSGNREAILNTYWYLNPYRYNNGDILRLGNLPTNVLMTDYMYARYGYVDGFNHGSNGLNVLFVDSSVRWVIDHRIYGLLDGVKNNDDWATSYNAITDCWNYIEEAY